MLSSRTLSLTIPRHWLDLYETIWKPEFFPKWAPADAQCVRTRWQSLAC